jgi:hypothetical protein
MYFNLIKTKVVTKNNFSADAKLKDILLRRTHTIGNTRTKVYMIYSI